MKKDMNYKIRTWLVNTIPEVFGIDWFRIDDLLSEKIADLGVAIIKFGNPYRDESLAYRLMNLSLEYRRRGEQQ